MMKYETIVCPFCGNGHAHITYEENRAYQMNCPDCHNAIFHQDVSWDAAVAFFKHMAITDDDRLAEICAAEKDGRVAVLPCKVGDTFYTIEQQWTLCHLDNYRDEYSCQGCEEEKCDSKKVPEIVAHKCSTVSQLAAYIGKTVFLTRPEAEAALASAKQVEASAVASDVRRPGGEQT